MLRTSHICAFIVMAAFIGTIDSALAQKSTLPTGTWNGVMSGGKTGAVRIQVNFQPNGAQVHFYAPFSCLAQASFVQSTSEGSVFLFKSSPTGGVFCGKLSASKLIVNKPSPSGMAFSLTSAGVPWSGTLRPGP